jgi:hypothetical protein
MICLSHTYRAERPTVQVHISPLQFSTVNDNTKQFSECLDRTETLTSQRTDTYCSGSFADTEKAMQEDQ